MNATCRNASACSMSHQTGSASPLFVLARLHSGDPISSRGFEGSTNLRHLERQSVLLESNTISGETAIVKFEDSHWRRPSEFLVRTVHTSTWTISVSVELSLLLLLLLSPASSWSSVTSDSGSKNQLLELGRWNACSLVVASDTRLQNGWCWWLHWWRWSLPHLHPRGDVSCAQVPKLGETLPGPLQSHVLVVAFAGTTLFGMVNRPLTSKSCGKHAQANCLRTQTARNRFCTVALVAPVEIQALVVVLALPRVVATQGALIPMPPPSYSSASGPNSLPRASCNELPHTSSVHGGLHGFVYSCTQRGEDHAVVGHLLPLLDVASKQTEHVQIAVGEVSHIAHWPLRPCCLQGVVEMAHGLRLVGRPWNVRLATSVLAPCPDGGLDPYHVSCSTMRPLSSFSRCLCSPCSSTWRSLTYIGGRGISVSLSTAVTVIDHTCHRECSHSSDATFHETRIGSSAAVAPGGARLLLPQWASVRFHTPPFSVCLLVHFERFAHYTPCLPLRSGRWCAKSLPCKSPAFSLQVVPVCSTEETPAPQTRCHANSRCSLYAILAQACKSANIVAPALVDFANTYGCGLNRARRDRTRPEYQRVPKHLASVSSLPSVPLSDSLIL